MGDGQSHESDVAQAEERLPESVPETAFADGTVSAAASAIASVARPAHVKGSASPPAAPQRPRRRIRASEALALQRTAGNAATVRLLLRDKQRPTAELTIGPCTFHLSLDDSFGSRADSAYGLIMATGPSEFLGVGKGFSVSLTSSAPSGQQVGIAWVDEGTFQDGKWVPGRRLNGDEDDQGVHWRFDARRLTIEKMKIYRFD